MALPSTETVMLGAPLYWSPRARMITVDVSVSERVLETVAFAFSSRPFCPDAAESLKTVPAFAGKTVIDSASIVTFVGPARAALAETGAAAVAVWLTVADRVASVPPGTDHGSRRAQLNSAIRRGTSFFGAGFVGAGLCGTARGRVTTSFVTAVGLTEGLRLWVVDPPAVVPPGCAEVPAVSAGAPW